MRCNYFQSLKSSFTLNFSPPSSLVGPPYVTLAAHQLYSFGGSNNSTLKHHFLNDNQFIFANPAAWSSTSRNAQEHFLRPPLCAIQGVTLSPTSRGPLPQGQLTPEHNGSVQDQFTSHQEERRSQLSLTHCTGTTIIKYSNKQVNFPVQIHLTVCLDFLTNKISKCK